MNGKKRDGMLRYDRLWNKHVTKQEPQARLKLHGKSLLTNEEAVMEMTHRKCNKSRCQKADFDEKLTLQTVPGEAFVQVYKEVCNPRDIFYIRKIPQLTIIQKCGEISFSFSSLTIDKVQKPSYRHIELNTTLICLQELEKQTDLQQG